MSVTGEFSTPFNTGLSANSLEELYQHVGQKSDGARPPEQSRAAYYLQSLQNPAPTSLHPPIWATAYTGPGAYLPSLRPLPSGSDSLNDRVEKKYLMMGALDDIRGASGALFKLGGGAATEDAPLCGWSDAPTPTASNSGAVVPSAAPRLCFVDRRYPRALNKSLAKGDLKAPGLWPTLQRESSVQASNSAGQSNPLELSAAATIALSSLPDLPATIALPSSVEQGPRELCDPEKWQKAREGIAHNLGRSPNWRDPSFCTNLPISDNAKIFLKTLIEKINKINPSIDSSSTQSDLEVLDENTGLGFKLRTLEIYLCKARRFIRFIEEAGLEFNEAYITKHFTELMNEYNDACSQAQGNSNLSVEQQNNGRKNQKDHKKLTPNFPEFFFTGKLDLTKRPEQCEVIKERLPPQDQKIIEAYKNFLSGSKVWPSSHEIFCNSLTRFAQYLMESGKGSLSSIDGNNADFLYLECLDKNYFQLSIKNIKKRKRATPSLAVEWLRLYLEFRSTRNSGAHQLPDSASRSESEVGLARGFNRQPDPSMHPHSGPDANVPWVFEIPDDGESNPLKRSDVAGEDWFAGEDSGTGENGAGGEDWIKVLLDAYAESQLCEAVASAEDNLAVARTLEPGAIDDAVPPGEDFSTSVVDLLWSLAPFPPIDEVLKS